MNFGLNKIDTDIRKKLREETRDGKIHSKEKVLITKDEEKNRDKTFDKIIEEKNIRKNKEKEYLEKKVNNSKISSQKSGRYIKDTFGNFIDIKK